MSYRSEIDGALVITDATEPGAPPDTAALDDIIYITRRMSGRVPAAVVYRDATGACCGVRDAGGRFNGFYPICATELPAAIAEAKAGSS